MSRSLLRSYGVISMAVNFPSILRAQSTTSSAYHRHANSNCGVWRNKVGCISVSSINYLQRSIKINDILYDTSLFCANCFISRPQLSVNVWRHDGHDAVCRLRARRRELFCSRDKPEATVRSLLNAISHRVTEGWRYRYSKTCFSAGKLTRCCQLRCGEPVWHWSPLFRWRGRDGTNEACHLRSDIARKSCWWLCAGRRHGPKSGPRCWSHRWHELHCECRWTAAG